VTLGVETKGRRIPTLVLVPVFRRELSYRRRRWAMWGLTLRSCGFAPPSVSQYRLQLIAVPLLAGDSTLSIPNKPTLYKLCIRSILTYATPVWSNTSSYNYRRLLISQSKCLRVIGNYPRRASIPRIHTTLNVKPTRDFIYRLTANFFDRRSAHPNPLVRSIRNYSLATFITSIRNTHTNVLSTFSSNHFPPTTELHFGQSDYRTRLMKT